MPCFAAESDEVEIRAILDRQAAAWNKGQIEEFMNFYWRSDETTFVGANGVKKGWQSILEQYRQRYPDRQSMGTLTFSNLEVHVVGDGAAYAIGEFALQREKDGIKDAPSGFFSLFLRKFADGWRIVLDHTTARAVKK